MENKYEITDICHKRNGVTLHRIRAIRDFGNVKVGDLGGWIEHKGNLSQLGDCWVYDEAVVCGHAYVYGQAVICDEAVICDNVQVSGEAQIRDKAKVSMFAVIYGEVIVRNNARVRGRTLLFNNALVENTADCLTISPIGSRDGCTTFFRTADGGISVACGCFRGTIEGFEQAVEKTHGSNKHGQAYRKAIELARIQLGRKK